MATITVAAMKIQLKKMEKPSMTSEPWKAWSRAVGRQVRLLVPQAEPGKPFAEDQEKQQILALPRIGENHKIEQQDGASEQGQHHRRDEDEVIGAGVELIHWPRLGTASYGRGSATRWRARASDSIPGRTRSTICCTGFSRMSKYGLG